MMLKTELVARSVGLRLTSFGRSRPLHELYAFIRTASKMTQENHTEAMNVTIPVAVDARVSRFRVRNGVMSFVTGETPPYYTRADSLAIYRIPTASHAVDLATILQIPLLRRTLMAHQIDVSQDLVVIVYNKR